jgi:dTDP-4-dehydrorhamnose 3,5-epimerase
VTRGTVFAAVADVRPDRATFGRVACFLLGDEPGERIRLFVGEGLANAFCVVGDQDADYLYDVTAEWSPDAPRLGIAWDDPDLAVPWPLDAPVVSAADRDHPTLQERFGRPPG